jgi:hypothetical protein
MYVHHSSLRLRSTDVGASIAVNAGGSSVTDAPLTELSWILQMLYQIPLRQKTSVPLRHIAFVARAMTS